jgi:hypothetical protein
MTYVHADIVREVLSVDGKSKVDFLKRRDGLYEFRGYVEKVEGELYWSPIEHSGLYSTPEEAERSAIAQMAWLAKTGHYRDLGVGRDFSGPDDARAEIRAAVGYLRRGATGRRPR